MYLTRVVERELEQLLGVAGAVLLEGPKACGKTQTARRFAKSEVLLDIDQNALRALSLDPASVLNGPAPRLVDEWQMSAETVWNNVRRICDDRPAPGQFLLTGSVHPGNDSRRHSGAGRFATVRMRPLSLFEAGRSTAEISLAGLFAGERYSCGLPDLALDDFIEAACVGGWPHNLDLTPTAAMRLNRDYLNQIRNADVGELNLGRRDPQRLQKFFRTYARNVGSEASIKTLAADMSAGEETETIRATVYAYLDIMERLLIVEDQPAWSTHLRSSATLRQQPKRHFVDPSLAVAALATSPDALKRDLNYFGMLFESMCIRDLRTLSQPFGGEVYHYRDSKGREADAIVTTADGRWGAFEIKLGAGGVDEGIASLQRVVEQVDLTKAGVPAVLGVITGADYGYVKDGVQIIPLGALCP